MINGIKHTQNQTWLPRDQSLGVEKPNTKPARGSGDSIGRSQEEEEPQGVRAKRNLRDLDSNRV